MRASKTERVRAERVSAAVDQFLREPGAAPEGLDPDEAGVLATAQQLLRLPALLGPVPPVLEQQVMRQVRATGRPARGVPRLGLGWAVAGLVTVLLLVVLFTPLGQTAVAGFMAAFNLGRTEVTIQPVHTPSTLPATAMAGATAVRESLELEEAQGQVSYAIPQPAYLPSGYRLAGVNGYTYPDLPAWVPQPFFLELVYKDSAGDELLLRVYSITLGDEGSISELNLQATSIQDARNVDVSGQAGVLLQLGSDRTGAVWQEVVWEQGDLIVALSSGHLAEDELLRVARSVQ
jgi:hypothetical protein